MKTRHFLLLFILLALTACGNPQEEARTKLGQMKIDYDEGSFVKQARAGNLQAVKLFLQASMNPNAIAGRGETALVNAARYGRQDVVQVLLAKGADPNVKSKDATALNWAALNGFTGIAKLLLDRGADVKATGGPNHMNALMCAGMTGKADIVKFLIQRGSELNVRDKDGKTALIWAARPWRPTSLRRSRATTPATRPPASSSASCAARSA